MSTVAPLTVRHHQGFHILQDQTSHALGSNLIKHITKYFLRQLELRRRCEFYAFESLFIIRAYATHIFCKKRLFQ